MFGFNNAKKMVQNTIPYKYVYEDGIIESEEGSFSKSYRIGDINFETASDEEQLRIFHAYEDLLSSLDDNVSLQILIQNLKKLKSLDILQNVAYKPLRDTLNDYRQEMNSLIADRLVSGKNGLEQNKCFVVSINDTDTKHAKTSLNAMDRTMNMAVKRISPRLEAEPMTIVERLRFMFDTYNQDGEGVFENAKKKDGTPFFSFRHMSKMGRTTKDEIAPSGFDFKATYFQMGNIYGKAMCVEKIPPKLTTEFLQELANINCPSLISIMYEPLSQDKAMKLVKNNISAIDAEIEARKGSTTESIKNAREGSVDLLNDLVNRKQKAYYTTVTIVVFGETMEEMNAAAKQVTSIGTNKQAPVRTLFGKQMEGLNTCLPLCRNYTNERKLLTTESASVFLPFTSLELMDIHGINYGTNEVSKNQIFYNRTANKNYNGLIISKSGGGKSASVKLEVLQTLLRSKKNHVHIIDPHGEYVKFAKCLGGEVISLAANTDKYLNPFDIDFTADTDEDPLAIKSDYILGMIEIIQHGTPLDPRECSIIDRCVHNIYKGYIEHIENRRAIEGSLSYEKDNDAIPTLKDLYYELKAQNDRDADNIAKTIEMYATGSMQLFANRTTVDTENRLTVYDIRRLGTGTKNLGLYVCLNTLKNEAIKNKKAGNWTYMYIDEMQSVMGSDISTKPISNIWATIRKFNGIPTGILQNTNNLLASIEGRNILNNSNMIMVLDTGATDRANLIDYLNLSEAEAEHINNAKVGHGLLCVGSLRIPFNNWIDKDKYPLLYNLINTTTDTERAS